MRRRLRSGGHCPGYQPGTRQCGRIHALNEIAHPGELDLCTRRVRYHLRIGGSQLYDHLEKVLEGAFKREYEQDENVVRSLPFFATALGVVVAIFGQLVARVPGAQPWRTIAAFLLALAAFAFGRTLWCLFQTVRARTYQIPPNELTLIAWCEDLRDFYIANGKSLADAEIEVKADLQKEMVMIYANSASYNRPVNQQKTAHRTRGLTWLIILLTLASANVAVIVLSSQLSSFGTGVANDVEGN